MLVKSNAQKTANKHGLILIVLKCTNKYLKLTTTKKYPRIADAESRNLNINKFGITNVKNTNSSFSEKEKREKANMQHPKYAKGAIE